MINAYIEKVILRYKGEEIYTWSRKVLDREPYQKTYSFETFDDAARNLRALPHIILDQTLLIPRRQYIRVLDGRNEYLIFEDKYNANDLTLTISPSTPVRISLKELLDYDTDMAIEYLAERFVNFNRGMEK